MNPSIESLTKQITTYQANTPQAVEAFRLAFTSKKGAIAQLFEQLRDLPTKEKKALGLAINELKKKAFAKYAALKEALPKVGEQENPFPADLTIPPAVRELGALHPITLIQQEIIDIFSRIGFQLSEGPEIEDDWHNFTALNFLPDHPAREMQDTFFMEQNTDMLLRTHTSSVQVRVMQAQKPPIRTLAIGKVFRKETISARSHCLFHQVEGLYVNEKVSFKDLKETLLYFVKSFFGTKTKVRLRPSFFPFTEPSAEVDVSCMLCDAKGCSVCKHSGWVEIAGAGMVDPAVFTHCGIDKKHYTGFAFGMGIERMAMLRYQIPDIRLFTQNNLRFLNQFMAS